MKKVSFKTISANSFNECKQRVFSQNKDEELGDILSQIYVNAQICTLMKRKGYDYLTRKKKVVDILDNTDIL